MDLLTVLEHEAGHVLGFEHTEQSAMDDTLATGTRQVPEMTGSILDAAIVELTLAKKK